MGKKRAATATTRTPVFPFAAAADETEPTHHFSDYGFDPQLLRLSPQPNVKRHQQQTPALLDPWRFKLQKPISKKHQHAQHNSKQRRRGWWSSAASAALLFFKRPSSKSNPTAQANGRGPSSSCSAAAAFAPRPLYFADDGGDDDSTGCMCWSPAVRSGHLAAAELGIASVGVPYVSLRDASFHGGAGGTGGAAPAMPIYLVT
ncbi:hypothetical protein D1007_13887 [Hordeum vulgare]|uniref:Uncharacterized protein n=1 Tax=Hordeum vulgare subsp. vulgare TaxID=112509 RepID=A0A8I6W6H5_HORVV|nr:uncharacterized protein LOC123412282 [Hordeum vulgare subsp. vulgare]KAE8809469.1 hypothetical protein D1007_13887 [Hordeum vulgare]